MKPGFADYLREAFNARPLGLLVPPNWLGIGAFGLLGVLNPGFWLVGAGLEAAYLLLISHHPRFRAVVDGKYLLADREKQEKETDAVLNRLAPARRKRFLDLRARCEKILSLQHLEADSTVSQMQADGLGKLLGIHLRLLLTQAAMEKMLEDSDTDVRGLERKLAAAQQSLEAEPEGTELRRSLEGQIAIMNRRKQALDEGAEKLAFTESELVRIEQQIALIRDEVGLSAAPEAVGSQIDRVSGELNETNVWINEQQKLFGAAELTETFGVPLSQSQ